MPLIDQAQEIRELREPKMCIYCGGEVSKNIYEQYEHLEKIHIIRARHIRNTMIQTAFISMRKVTA